MSEQVTKTSENLTIGLTEAAANKVWQLLTQEDRLDLRLRVAVSPGGCSGLIYQLYFDDRELEGDTIYPQEVTENGETVDLIIDVMSLPYLAGAKVDFSDTLASTGFSIDNPNASGSCACGDSFH